MSSTTVTIIPIMDTSVPSVRTASSSSASLTTSPSVSSSTSSASSDSVSSITISSTSIYAAYTALNNPDASNAEHTTSQHSKLSQSTSFNHTLTQSAGSTSKTSIVSATAAAASTSTASQTALQPKDSPKWMTTTVFGGVIAGSFLSGALIAGLFVFALLRNRSKRSQYGSPTLYIPSHDHNFSGGKASTTSTVTTLTELTYLSQQIEDAEVKRRILSLADEIDQHVENFYRNDHVRVDEKIETSLSVCETRQMPNPLALCFESATQPLVLIRHCLGFHIFSQTVAPVEDIGLVLPAEITGMVNAMYHKCLSSSTSRDTITAFSLWKNLTGYLRPDLATGMASMHATSHTAYEVARNFSDAFAAWSNSQYTEDRRIDHLAALVDHAIDIGTWLFQQPDSYRFTWNTLSHNGRNSTAKMMSSETVVVPGVFKMTHMGVLLNGQGQSIVQPVVKPF